MKQKRLQASVLNSLADPGGRGTEGPRDPSLVKGAVTGDPRGAEGMPPRPLDPPVAKLLSRFSPQLLKVEVEALALQKHNNLWLGRFSIGLTSIAASLSTQIAQSRWDNAELPPEKFRRRSTEINFPHVGKRQHLSGRINFLTPTALRFFYKKNPPPPAPSALCIKSKKKSLWGRFF